MCLICPMDQTMTIIFYERLANDFERKLEYLIENIEKYKTFSVLIEI